MDLISLSDDNFLGKGIRLRLYEDWATSSIIVKMELDNHVIREFFLYDKFKSLTLKNRHDLMVRMADKLLEQLIPVHNERKLKKALGLE